MTRKLPFMGKVSQLLTVIRERQTVNLGEACAVLNVDPDSIKRRYVPVILDLCPDVRFDGKRFETIVERSPVDQNQKKVEDYLRRV